MAMGKEKEKQIQKGKGKRSGRVEMRIIENPIRRQITFSKRKTGLFKKAAELSLLCDVDLALIISSPSGKLFHSPAPSIDTTLGRYEKFCASSGQSAKAPGNIEFLNLELEKARKLQTNLEITQKHMIGEDLDSLSYKELDLLEKKLEIGVGKICSKKEKIFKYYIQSQRKKLKSTLLGDQKDGKEGPINVTVGVTANYQQPEPHDGDSDYVAISQTILGLSLY